LLFLKDIKFCSP